MVFIGLVALALVVIAAGIGAVAWFVVRLLAEVTIITRRLHQAGEIVAEDVAQLRSQIKGGKFIYSIAKHIWPKKTHKKLQPPQE